MRHRFPFPPRTTPLVTDSTPHPLGPLRIAFLGFNPLGDGYDGRGKIDVGADRTFSSLDSLGALRLIRRHVSFRKSALRHAGAATAGPAPSTSAVPWPIDLRITGYSFGGWTALQLAHALSAAGPRRFRIRIGLVDPVCTFRSRRALRVAKWVAKLPSGWSVPLLALVAGPAYASRPACAVRAVNYFQSKGLIARFNGDGFRLPYRANWFASQPIDGFDLNHDATAEVTAGGGHIEVAERYAARVAAETFGGP